MRTRTKAALGAACVLVVLLAAALALLRSGAGSGSAVPVQAGEEAAGRPAPGAEPAPAAPAARPAGDMADARVSAAPPAPAAPSAGTTEVERYPAMEAPDRVRAGQEFAVDVSLTEEQVDPSTKITGGRATPDRRLAMQLPAGVESWKIDIVLSASGFAFTRGSNTGSVILPKSGDSTSAVFHLRAPDIDTAPRPYSLRATLWHDGAYLGRIQRGVVVLSGAAPSAQPPPVASASADGSRPVVAAAAAAPAIDVGQSFETPDLTVYVLDRTLEASRSTELIISSPHLQPARYEVPRVPGRREWIAAQLAQLARRGRGFGTSVATAPTPAASDFARGFGRQLYRDCVPAPLKEAFWRVAGALGNRFRTIQIITDDPSFPWELVRPSPPGGGADRDFLGLEFGIARWHVGVDAPQLQRPPQEIRLERLMVVAPQYAGAAALPAQATEVAALKALPGFEAVGGRVAGLRELFQHPRAGIIHFSGHGSVREEAATSTFAIRLEDGDLDVTSWRGMAASGQAPHPLVFFNACDVGNARATAGLVEGWAPALLGAGASGYIGALWAVDDHRAAEFATQFYLRVDRDLRGGPSRPGQVLADTRRALFERTGDPTALAYVLYGDPLLRVVRADR